MKLSKNLLCCTVLGACLVGFGYGQEGSRSLTIPEECALRLTQQPVAAKLKLNAVQVSAIKKAQVAYESTTAKLTPKADPTGAKLDGATKSYAHTCLSTLTVDQKAELLMVGIPEIGIRALGDPAVSEKLKLTATQETKIRQIIAASAKEDEDYSSMIANALMAIPEPKASADRAAYDKKCADTLAAYEGERQGIARDKAASEKKVLAVMTKPQQVEWSKLSGGMPKSIK